MKKVTSAVIGVFFLSCMIAPTMVGQPRKEAPSDELLIVVGSQRAGVLQNVQVTLFGGGA
jgi:hypothetical protein